ncbi:MAG: hypothetical protein WC378_20735, partial [Opitutaceae bacterium]
MAWIPPEVAKQKPSADAWVPPEVETTAVDLNYKEPGLLYDDKSWGDKLIGLAKGTASGIGDAVSAVPKAIPEFVENIASDPAGFAAGLGGAAVKALRTTPGLLFPEMPSSRMEKLYRKNNPGKRLLPTEDEVFFGNNPTAMAASEAFKPAAQAAVSIPLARAAGAATRGLLPVAKSATGRTIPIRGMELLAELAEGQAAGLPYAATAMEDAPTVGQGLKDVAKLQGMNALIDLPVGAVTSGVTVRGAVKAANKADEIERLAEMARKGVETVDLSKPKQLGGVEQFFRGIGDKMNESDWRAVNEAPAPRTTPLPEYARAS